MKILNDPSLYPVPLSSTPLPTANYSYSNASQINTDQGDIKLDWRPNNKDYWSARYSHGRQDHPAFNTFPLLYNSFANFALSKWRNQLDAHLQSNVGE